MHVNSTNAMDCFWALGFLLAALDAAPAGRPLLAGALLFAFCTGHWQLLIEPSLPAPGTEHVAFRDYVDRDTLREHLARGAPAFFLPGVAERAMTVFRYPIIKEGAKPLYKEGWEWLGLKNAPAPLRTLGGK